jgi:hypothetical protein
MSRFGEAKAIAKSEQLLMTTRFSESCKKMPRFSRCRCKMSFEVRSAKRKADRSFGLDSYEQDAISHCVAVQRRTIFSPSPDDGIECHYF